MKTDHGSEDIGRSRSGEWGREDRAGQREGRSAGGFPGGPLGGLLGRPQRSFNYPLLDQFMRQLMTTQPYQGSPYAGYPGGYSPYPMGQSPMGQYPVSGPYPQMGPYPWQF